MNVNEEAAEPIPGSVIIDDGKRYRVLACPDNRPDCEVLHLEPVDEPDAGAPTNDQHS